MPKAYIVARVTITDPEAYARYAEGARQSIERHGARILARGGRVVGLEGEVRSRNVILEFPSMDAALAYWGSDDYQAARSHRLGAAEIELCAIEGVD